ncbi:MAG: CDP-alcohol phosphatidyltransferase family protein [Candidatus Kapabacteria bacterium]|nr:CDP-alcohol phosphatidyltransferase family protein [Candidatus Kapabacteria bacterium]
MNLQLSSDRFITASNAISFVRLLLAVPVVVTLMREQYAVAFVLCWIGAFTDWLDGYVARRTGTVSEWGKIIDPVADKVLVGSVVLVLLTKGLLPLWFVAAVITRDVIIMIGASLARRRVQVILPSLMSGKLAVSAIALTGVVSMIDQGPVRDWLIVTSCAVMAVSLWQYTMRLHGLLR